MTRYLRICVKKETFIAKIGAIQVGNQSKQENLQDVTLKVHKRDNFLGADLGFSTF
jgi:hypothetical protein